MQYVQQINENLLLLKALPSLTSEVSVINT